jgi:spore maturation protein CgeB
MEGVISEIDGFCQIPFCQQMETLGKLKVDSCDALSRELRTIGHQVEDVYFDLEIPQKKWAEENNFKSDDENWENQILLKQIEIIKPDILFFQKITRLPRSILYRLKKAFPSIKKVVFHTAYLGNLGDLGWVDLLLVGTPSLVQRFRRKGCKPHLFYHYFDPGILFELNKTEIKQDKPITFLGSSGFGGGYLHADRYETLVHLLNKTEIEMWLSEPSFQKRKVRWKDNIRSLLKELAKRFPEKMLSFLSNKQHFGFFVSAMANECLREKIFHKTGRELPSKPIRELFPDRCQAAVMGMDYYRIMAKSKISFTKACNNIFDGNENKSGDIGALRLFESTGLGSCLVADTGANMKDLFEDGKEIVTYASKHEAVEKIKYLLSNEEIRIK